VTAFEYLLPFVSILIGLAVADLAFSLHRLLRARRRVRWDWLPLASAVLVLLLILQFWWSFYIIGRIEVWSSYGAFLLVTTSLISIFLLASAALPDEVPPEGIDLRLYYEESQAYFWTLFAVFILLSTITNAVPSLGRASLGTTALFSLPNLILVVLLLSLSRIRSRTYHSVALVLLFTVAGLLWFQLRLSSPT